VQKTWGLTAGGWDAVTAIATAGTFVVALAAAVFAWMQVRHARQIRLDQSRPYVVVTLEPGQTSIQFVEVVIRNVGSTAAFNTTIAVTPPLVRAREDAGAPMAAAKVFTEPIAIMAPGFEQRMWFDSYIEREPLKDDLPSSHTAVVSYSDRDGHSWTDTYVLDVDAGRGQMHVEAFGIHHAAAALRGIEKAIAKRQPLAGSFDVAVESRSERDERVAAERQAMSDRDGEFKRREAERRRAAESDQSSATEEDPG
jgi:hypothetical protein